MKPFTRHNRAAADCGRSHPVQDPEGLEPRSVLFEDHPDCRSDREHTSRDNKKSSSKDSKSHAGPGNACRASHRKANVSTLATEVSTGIVDTADPLFLTDIAPISPAVAAGDDAIGISLAANTSIMEKLQSTLLTLTARKLPSGPLPKMDEVIARFMNISPKQWLLLNTTIDELNGRFKHGALHWLLLRWLVAAHPEQFFPPPFNSYQQLLQQVSQKDAEVKEAKSNAAKWRDTCARLEGERRTWKRQLQQMEKEVSELYNALAERQEPFPTNEAHVKHQQPQQRPDMSGGAAAALPAVRKQAVRDEPHQQQPYQVTQLDQAEQRHHEQLQPQEQKCKHHSQNPKVQEDFQEDKQPAAMLLRQLVHPVSSAQDACPGEPVVGRDVPKEEPKKDAGPSDVSRATTTARTKTTVTTTKSNNTSSHSVCVTKESDPDDDGLTETRDQHMRDNLAGERPHSPRAFVDVCDKERTGDEASLVNILGCVQNLLRRITANGKDCPVHSPSSSCSLQAGEGSEMSAFTSPNKRQLCRRHGKKVQRKNVELWYLQYQQKSSPSAAKDEDKEKRKQPLDQDEFGGSKKESNEEQGTPQVTCNLRVATKEMNKEEEKRLRDEPVGMEHKHVDQSALLLKRSGPKTAAGARVDAQLVDSHTDRPEAEEEHVYSPPGAACLQANAPGPHMSVTTAETTYAPHASATSETSSPPCALLQVSQENSSVNSYIRRFMALYKGGQHIPEVVAIRMFTEKLKPALKQYVRSRHPTSLAHAILLAGQGERYFAASGVPLSGERIRRENSSARATSREWPAAKLDEGYTTKRGGEVAEEKVSGHSIEQYLDVCPARATSSRINPQGVPAGSHQQRYLLKNEAAVGGHNAGQQWQVHLRETHYAHHLQPQQLTHLQEQQHQEQLLHNTELLEDEVWHSSEDTAHPVEGVFVMQPARKDYQQQPYNEDEQHQIVVEPTERIVIPRAGSKLESTERTHVVGNAFKRQQLKQSAA